MKKKFSAKALLLLILLTLALGTIIWFVTSSKNESSLIKFPYNVIFSKPTGWVVAKRVSENHVILSNKNKGTSLCIIDVFSVQPDRDYQFKQWLGTSLENQSFLAGGRETPYKDKTVFIGSYNFFNENVNAPAKNERAILKAKGTIVDVKMSYLENQSCPKEFDSFLDSVNF